jgi:hypothetical protein
MIVAFYTGWYNFTSGVHKLVDVSQSFIILSTSPS